MSLTAHARLAKWKTTITTMGFSVHLRRNDLRLSYQYDGISKIQVQKFCGSLYSAIYSHREWQGSTFPDELWQCS
jgi:hypothetical protein